MHNYPETVVISLCLGLSVIAAMVSSRYFLSRPGRRFEGDPPSIQPFGVAFSIWSVIFLLGLARALNSSLSSEHEPSRNLSLALHAASFFACAAWAPIYASDHLKLSACTIAMACGLAYASIAVHVPPFRAWEHVIAASVDLLAGWLSVAFLLSLVISQIAPDTPSFLLFGEACVALAAVLLSRPVVVLPCLWASVLQRDDNASVRLSIFLLILAFLASTHRLIHSSWPNGT